MNILWIQWNAPATARTSRNSRPRMKQQQQQHQQQQQSVATDISQIARTHPLVESPVKLRSTFRHRCTRGSHVSRDAQPPPPPVLTPSPSPLRSPLLPFGSVRYSASLQNRRHSSGRQMAYRAIALRGFFLPPPPRVAPARRRPSVRRHDDVSSLRDISPTLGEYH